MQTDNWTMSQVCVNDRTKTAPQSDAMAWDSTDKTDKIAEDNVGSNDSGGEKASKPGSQWRVFLETTSAHGWARTISGIRVSYRVLWVIVILGFYCVMLWSISEAVIDFYSWPAKEVSTIKQEPQTFPDISICNLDPISSYHYQMLKSNSSSYLHWYLRYLDTVSQYLADATTGTLQDPDILLDRYKSTFGLDENLPEDELKFISTSKQDFILSCVYAGARCTMKFAEFQTSSFLRCFTLEMNETIVTGTGTSSGVSLILYVENSREGTDAGEYNLFSPAVGSRGARVVVHPHGERPVMSSSGLDIIPGHSTNVAIKTEHVVRLGPPYDNCTTKATVEKTHIPYSSNLCKAACLQEAIVSVCGCTYPLLPLIGNEPLCGVLTKSIPNMTKSVVEIICALNSARGLGTDCFCAPTCDQTAYTYTITEAEWPATKYLQDFYNLFVLQSTNVGNMAAYRNLKAEYDAGFPDPALAQTSFIRLNVYFESEEVLERRQTPSYTSFTLLSDIGGTLGLWAGMSMLTLIEVVQLIADISLSFCNAGK